MNNLYYPLSNPYLPVMGFTSLTPAQEALFQLWYQQMFPHLNKNPDAPKQHYDYRAAYLNGMTLDPLTMHGSSQFKMAGHPNRFVPMGQGITLDTIQNLPLGDIRYNHTLPNGK